MLKELHPAIGKPARLVFPDIWDTHFEGVAQNVERTGIAARHEDVRIVLNRTGVPEETFFTYSFAPIRRADGTVCVISNLALETTKRVILERRMSTLLRLGEGTAQTTELSTFWDRLFASMSGNELDLPFAALYSIGDMLKDQEASSDGTSAVWKGDRCWLEGSFGFSPAHASVPNILDLKEAIGFAPAITTCIDGGSRLILLDKDGVPHLHDLLKTCPDRNFDVEYQQILVCPLRLSLDQTAAWLILGVNPMLQYDGDYQRFVDLLCRLIEDAGTAVLLLEKERQRLQSTVEHAEHQRQWLSSQLQQQTREARINELRFFNFAEDAPVGVFVMDHEGALQYGNETFRKMYSLPANIAETKPWRPRIHSEDLDMVDREWHSLISGQPKCDFEHRIVLENPSEGRMAGDTLYVRSTAFAEYKEDGSLKAVTGIVVDLSLHKAHERQAENRLAEALEAKRAQENFMDMVSHEMRNPLNAILQCAEEASESVHQLRSEREPDKNRIASFTNILDAIETISYCGVHQRQIIDDVLTISKLDSDLLTLSPAEILPTAIIQQAFKMFASEIRASDITTSWSSGSSSLDLGRTLVCIDSGRVLQILINLVGNSVKFLKGRPARRLHVNVSTTTFKPLPPDLQFVPSHRIRRGAAPSISWGRGKAVYVYFSVEDSGPGMTPEERSILFARFRQASPRTHAVYGGSGLGLFISRELAELHGGGIGLTSEVDKGSKFAFYVEGRVTEAERPAVLHASISNGEQMRTTASSNMKSTQSPAVASAITVLIVEDNLVNQKVLNRQLSKLGYRTITANHGAEALEAIQHSTWWHGNQDTTGVVRANPISVVLCDLEMPVMDGIACVRQVRAWQKERLVAHNIPMVAVTGNARTEQVMAAKEAGFDDVVCKPYSVPDLVPLIMRLVESKTKETTLPLR